MRWQALIALATFLFGWVFSSQVLALSEPPFTAYWIVEDTSGHVLNASRPTLPMTPASTTKLLTAVAAFLKLGSHFQFTTALKSPASVQNHTLNGDLYVVFGGDPTLAPQDLSQLIQSLKASGVDSIAGSLVIDDSIFDSRGAPIGAMAEDTHYGFGAPILGIILDENAVQIDIEGGGTTPHVESHPALPIENHLTVTSDSTLLKTCIFEPEVTDENRILLNGCLPPESTGDLKLALKNPRLYAAQLLTDDLAKNHISLKGPILFNKAPVNAQTLASHQSPPLSFILKVMLTESDNIIAGAVTKMLGVAVYQQGSFKAGISAIHDLIETLTPLPESQFKIEDGAGLSLYNRISPNVLASVLLAVHERPDLFSDIWDALPVAGESGTLLTRMQSPSLKGNVHAKTGSMTGGSTLCGYLTNSQGKLIIFAVMTDHFTGSNQPARHWQDEWLESVYRGDFTLKSAD